MCPSLSNNIKNAMVAESTNEVLVTLLEIYHPDFIEPILLSSDNKEVLGEYENGAPIYGTISRGKQYVYAPFSIILPSSPKDGVIEGARMVIGRYDECIIASLRSTSLAATIKAYTVLAESPDYIEQESPELWLDDIQYDAVAVTAQLGIQHFLSAICPSIRFDKYHFPAMFKD